MSEYKVTRIYVRKMARAAKVKDAVISYADGPLRCAIAGEPTNEPLRLIMIDRSLMSVEVEANDADALNPQLLAHRKSVECDALHQNRPLLRLVHP